MSKQIAAGNQSTKGENMIRKAVLCLTAAFAFSFITDAAQASRDEYYEHEERYERGEQHEERGERSEEVKFYGTIEALPPSGLNGTWRVSGRDVLVTERTYIKQEHGPVAVGASVEVKGGGDPFTAWEIEVQGSDRR